MEPLRFTILGECASKSNQRVLSTIGPKDNRTTILRKSQKAIDYVQSAVRQIPPRCRVRMQGPIALRLIMYYASMRPDMDEQLLLDCLQDQWARSKPSNPIIPSRRVLVQPGVYCNDRQIVERHIYRRQDPKQPRAEVEVWSAAPTEDMFAAEAYEVPLPF